MSKPLTKPQRELLEMLKDGHSISRDCLNGAAVTMMERLVERGLMEQRYAVRHGQSGNYFITDSGRAALGPG